MKYFFYACTSLMCTYRITLYRTELRISGTFFLWVPWVRNPFPYPCTSIKTMPNAYTPKYIPCQFRQQTTKFLCDKNFIFGQTREPLSKQKKIFFDKTPLIKDRKLKKFKQKLI